MKLRSALLAATVMVAPVAAVADPINGLYIGAGAGANYLQDETIKSIGYQQPVRSGSFPGSNLTSSIGFIGVGSIGYGLGNGLRFEVEGGYRQNKLRGVQGGLVNSTAGGDEVKYTGMVNALYDFDLNAFGVPLAPYVGVGVGYGYAQNQNVRIRGNSGPFLPGVPQGYPELLRSTNGDGSFAYQAIIGNAFTINAVPGLALTLEYRFLGLASDRTTNYQFFGAGAAGQLVTTRARVKTEDDYNHAVLVGVRYAFNQAPPPVVAAPPPVAQTAARTYLVFFDWDRADLTDRARQIIAEAAQATTRVQTTRILVNGYTDTSGTARYNQGLSVRRAQNVAAELVRLGVPRSAITAQGFGERDLLVQTGPGVREPQNRRVQIILQ